jgi:CheY-like chemotaxis protein
MMMPKGTDKVCREIKNDPQFRDIVVLLLTAVAEHVPKTTYTHFDGRTTLADDYIAKPIDLSKLMKIVKENLKQG